MSLELPWCISVDGRFHFWGPVHSQSCNPQDNDSSIKFSAGLTRWLQAQPRRLLSSAPVVSFPPGESALLGLLNGRFCSLRPCPSARSKSGHRFLSNLQHAQPSTPRSRFVLTTVAVSIPTLYTTRADHTRRVDRSFRRSGTDRPSRPICSSQSADSQTGCDNLYKTTN